MLTIKHYRIYLVKSLLLTILLYYNIDSLVAQNFTTRNYTAQDGLPSSAIRCIYKDSRGLLWIGNDGALCTYDGKSFSIIKTQEGKTLNQIWSITEDRQGCLWFGSYGEGVYNFDGQYYEQYTVKNGLSDNYIRKIFYSKKLFKFHL